MDKLNAVLEEYKALREAMLNNFRLQLQVYAIYASGLLVFYGLVFEHRVYDIILAVPVFALALLFRFLWQEVVIYGVGKYILQIEKQKIPLLVGRIDDKKKELRSANLCVGWQHYWEEREKQGGWPRYFYYSRIMVFIGFSVVPAVLYNIYNLFGPFWGEQRLSLLAPVWLLVILILNFSLGVYMWYTIRQVRKCRKHA